MICEPCLPAVNFTHVFNIPTLYGGFNENLSDFLLKWDLDSDIFLLIIHSDPYIMEENMELTDEIVDKKITETACQALGLIRKCSKEIGKEGSSGLEYQYQIFCVMAKLLSTNINVVARC